MKKNIFKSLLLTAVVSTVGIGSVCAETTDYEVQSSNVSDYSAQYIVSSEHARVEIKGLKTSKIGNYYYKIVDKNATTPSEIDKNTLLKNSGTGVYNCKSLSETEDGRFVSTIDNQSYIYDNDPYVYIYNCTKTVDYTPYCKVTTDKPIKLEKDPMPALTQRYKIYLFGDEDKNVVDPHISVFPEFPAPTENTEAITLNVKIGIIEDSSVISAMAKNEAGAVQKLYDYAKSATNGITFTGSLNNFYRVDTTSVAVQNGKYYYIYSDIEDPENKYIDVSDVTIAMGEYGMLVNDVKYGDYESIDYKDYEYGCYACTNDYVWTVKGYQASTCQLVDSITSKGNCVKSVKTGVEDYLVPGAIVMVVGGAIVTLLSRKTKFKRI